MSQPHYTFEKIASHLATVDPGPRAQMWLKAGTLHTSPFHRHIGLLRACELTFGYASAWTQAAAALAVELEAPEYAGAQRHIIHRYGFSVTDGQVDPF